MEDKKERDAHMTKTTDAESLQARADADKRQAEIERRAQRQLRALYRAYGFKVQGGGKR